MRTRADIEWDLWLAKGKIDGLVKQIEHLKHLNTRMENRIKEDADDLELIEMSLHADACMEFSDAKFSKSITNENYHKGRGSGLYRAARLLSQYRKTRNL